MHVSLGFFIFAWIVIGWQSFYSSLLQAGAEIYEYQPAMMHAKILNRVER